VTDIRLALRRLTATPGFFSIAVLTLALGMGVNTLLYSAVRGLLLKPLPMTDVDSLVWLFAESSRTPGVRETVSGAEGEALARSTTSLAVTAAIGDSALVREMEREHQRWRGIWATPGLIDVLKVTPALGAVPRELPPDDAPRAMLLGYSRWQRDYGGDTSIIGRELQFADNKRFVVAGVLPSRLEFPFARVPHKGNGAGFQAGEQDYWILAPDRIGSHPGGVMIGRLAPGRKEADVVAEVGSLTIERAVGDEPRSIVVVNARQQAVGSLGSALPLLQGFSLLVLAIACANLASLMTAREASRRTDVLVRMALGARASDLVRLRAAEAFVIVTCGAVLGLGIAWAGRYGLVLLSTGPTALLDRMTIDAGVLAALGIVVAVATMAFGVLPAMWRHQSASIPTSAGRMTRHDVQGPLRALVAAQVALSMMLVVSAVTLGHSLSRLLGVDAGYNPEDVVAADTILYTRDAETILPALRQRLRALPGIEAVGFVHSTPLTGQWIVRDPFEVMNGPAKGETPPIEGSFVAYDFFEALQIRLISGRVFAETDLNRRDFPIIINDIAARRYFPGRNAVGQYVRMTGALREIVGVVAATRDLALDSEPEAQWYQPALFGTSQLLVRGAGVSRLTDVLRREILLSDPRFIIQRITPLDQIVAGTVAERRLAARLVSLFAGLALLLAGLGLYGVMSFGVAQRRREFGIRSALGASARQILTAQVGRGLATTGAGMAAGALLSWFAIRLLKPLVFDAPDSAWGPLGIASLVLLAVGLLASWGPARKAAHTSPSITLTDL
jgi:putative ABC transport system permease protein